MVRFLFYYIGAPSGGGIAMTLHRTVTLIFDFTGLAYRCYPNLGGLECA